MTDLAQTHVRDTDLAALAGVSPRYVRKLAEEGKIERVGRNRFALGSIATIVQSLRREGTAAQLLQERVRKAAADATLAELAVIKAKGEVAPVAEFERALHMRNAIIQTNVMHVPARAVLQLLGETDERRFREVLTAELRTALKQAADTEITEADFDEDFRDNDECDESDEGPEGGN